MRFDRAVLFGALLALAAYPGTGLRAQTRPYSQGRGGIRGAPVVQVQTMELHPEEVTVLNLHPRFHTFLEFDRPVARVDAGDPDVMKAEIVGNKVSIKAIDVDVVETSMTVLLGDAEQTLVPFVVRCDTTQPMAYVIKFVDPVTAHLNRTEDEIAKRLADSENDRVDDLAEAHVRERLLYSGGSLPINRKAVSGSKGDRLGFVIEAAEQMPGPDGRARLYMRYRIQNATRHPLADGQIVATIGHRERRLLFFSRTVYQEASIAEDVRTAPTIPAGQSVRGLLILDGVTLMDGQWLTLQLSAFGGKRTVEVERALVGAAH